MDQTVFPLILFLIFYAETFGVIVSFGRGVYFSKWFWLDTSQQA